MEDQRARIHVTKLAAAQRQLRASIRMYFQQEDELAVHTVAFAAYKLIADLKSERGIDEAADHWLTSVFYVVRDYRRGTLPRQFTEDREAMEWISRLAETLPIEADSELRDVKVTLDERSVKRFWNSHSKAANFLKHADKGTHRALLDVSGLDNLTLIFQAMASYTDLSKDGLGIEGHVLWLYKHAFDGHIDSLPELHRKAARQLAEVPMSNRRSYCFALIRESGRESDA